MSSPTDVSLMLAHHFVAVIFDNEVTVGAFVTDPPLCWVRLIQRAGTCEIADGYPTVLTADQATFEMTNWDVVSFPALISLLRDVGRWADFVVLGNNAGQGVPLAQHVPPDVVAEKGAVIYAQSLPELEVYQQLGYRLFYPRKHLVSHLLELAEVVGQPLALCFVNTIQHNALNYHTP